LSEEKNPYIEPENYFEGYQDSIDKMKERPEFVEFDKLCHLVFGTPDGKHLMEEIERRYLLPALCSPTVPNYQTMVIYTEGFKDAFRSIKSVILSHEQRIKAENTPK
jgi:hypothetical protein